MKIKKINEYFSSEDELIICWLAETDGEVKVKKLPISEIKKMTKDMDKNDYALMSGDIVKNFNKSNVDWNKIGDAIKKVKVSDKKQREIKGNVFEKKPVPPKPNS